MKQESSAGAVVYYLENEKPVFLLLKNTLKTTYWGFPKGKIEDKESIEQTLIREVKEETNLHGDITPGFKYEQNWFFKLNNELIKKQAIFLLIMIKKAQVPETMINEEHQEFRWLGFEEAIKLMKIKQNREMLQAANKFILKNMQQRTL
jgi:8-oxo-dGTP pyrophosphatase MutT (NUDIX family)